jgi:hypothetical protein
MKLRTTLQTSSIWLLAGALAGGCTGAIGPKGSGTPDTQAGPGTGTGSSTAGTGTGTTGNGTGTGTGTAAGTTGNGTGTGNQASPGNGTSGGTNPVSTTNGSIPPVTNAVRDPGRVTTRRLNRAEYDKTVHDLLGTAQTLGASLFPDDAPQVGFDNNGDLQTLSPVQFNLYQQAAETLAAEAMTAGSAERAKLVACDLTTAACKTSAVTSFGLKAFRRPLAATEVTNFVNLMATAATAGATTDEQFRTVLEAMLLSPNFLFRPELDADPTSLAPHLLNPYETASRLSYMVYRSMPDDALFAAAAAGSLAQPADVKTQLERMLTDPKSVFSPTFVSQWLGTGVVNTQTFDATLFPKFNPTLAKSMGQEVNMFFNEFVTQNEPISQLLTANFSYLDNNLATLYGVAPAGATMTRTTITSPQRGGLLTMAGVLAVTSYPTRTSVVKRGAWVLSQLLCSSPPPPPANVPPFPTAAITATAQKEVLAQHRADPACGVCHTSIDNIGIAMENYDAIGAYRTVDLGTPIDATGSFAGPIALPGGGTGPTFTGAIQLASTVAADARFVPCVAQNVMAYSLGRALLPSDAPYLSDITASSAAASVGMRDVLMNVVASDTFRMRRGDPTTMTGVKP